MGWPPNLAGRAERPSALTISIAAARVSVPSLQFYEFTNVTVLTVTELHYKFWKWHNLQRSWNIEYYLYREHEIQKGGPQIMTSWYDDAVPGMLIAQEH